MSLVLLLFYMHSYYDCQIRLMYSQSFSIPVLHEFSLQLHNAVTADVLNFRFSFFYSTSFFGLFTNSR